MPPESGIDIGHWRLLADDGEFEDTGTLVPRTFISISARIVA